MPEKEKEREKEKEKEKGGKGEIWESAKHGSEMRRLSNKKG